MLPEIVATFLELAPLLVERTRKQEEQTRIFAERQRLWELEREQRQQDDNQWRRFLELADVSNKCEIARSFIARIRELELPTADPIDGRILVEWLDWAEQRANGSDPLSQGAEHIFSNIAEVKYYSYSAYAR